MSDPAVNYQIITPANTHLLNNVNQNVFDNKVQPDYLRGFLANPANILAVATINDQVVGMASGIAYYHPDKPLQLFVNEVSVADEYLRRGIAKKLLAVLLERGKAMGCDLAWVATEVDNAPACALYKSFGFKEDEQKAVVFSHALNDT